MTFADGFDICMLIITATFAVKGIFKGFSGEVFSLLGILGGIYVAFLYVEPLDSYMRSLFPSLNGSLSWLLSLALIFIVFNVLCNLLGMLLRKVLQMVWLSALDRLGGFVVGAAKGLAITLILVVLLSKLQALAPGLDLSSSRFVMLANELLPLISPHIDTALPIRI